MKKVICMVIVLALLSGCSNAKDTAVSVVAQTEIENSPNLSIRDDLASIEPQQNAQPSDNDTTEGETVVKEEYFKIDQNNVVAISKYTDGHINVSMIFDGKDVENEAAIFNIILSELVLLGDAPYSSMAIVSGENIATYTVQGGSYKAGLFEMEKYEECDLGDWAKRTNAADIVLSLHQIFEEIKK